MDLLLDYEIPFLHPLVVHFPVVLILLGAGAAALYAVLGRGAWRRAALVLFALGALSAWAAAETGPPLADALRGDPVVDRVVETHAAAAEGALATSAFAAALFALLSALALRRRPPAGEEGGEAPRPRREPLWGRFLGLVLGAAAAAFVAWTAYLGGLMVWGVPT